MHHHTGHPGVAAYLGMWMLMMVPMMLPSLVPVLVRYRRSVRGVGEMHAYGLTGLVMAGYFAVWAVIGIGVWVAGAGIKEAEMRWGWVGEWKSVGVLVVLILAGMVQVSEWKARHLAHWRRMEPAGDLTGPTIPGAFNHGLRNGLQCSVSCGNLMLALLCVGMMNVVAMVVVTITIAAERLAPTQSHPPRNPARRSPVTTLGQRRMMFHSNADR